MRRCAPVLCPTILLFLAVALSAAQSPDSMTHTVAAIGASGVTHLNPPHFGFYGKLLGCDGISVRAASGVSDNALILACQKIQMMLANAPVARQNLVAKGAELHIIGASQNDSDLPEHRYQRGEAYVDSLGHSTDIDRRTRGVGGVYSSCGEENLLHLPSDRYKNGFDICIHEFAHDIMDNGFDPAIQQEITRVYHASIGKGLWRGAYAAVNPQEYFAELSTWYFGARGNYVHDQEPASGPVGLRAYDPDGYELLDSLYKGRIQPALAYMLVAKRVRPGEVSGIGTSPAQLVLVNNTRERYQLLWVSSTGATTVYGKLEPYSRFSINTSIGHVWELKDTAGQSAARFLVSAPEALATIDNR
jgi:VHL beta domain